MDEESHRTWNIRPENSVDRDDVLDVVRRAFEDHGDTVAALVEALSPYKGASLVAEVAEKLVGHVQLSRSWLDARQRLVDVLVLSPLTVGPERQGIGIGTALVAAAIAAAEGLGAPLLFLEGDPDYYSERGFEPAANHGFLRPSQRIPEPAFQVRVLSAYEPWMRGALVYAEPFWTLDCVGLRDPRLAAVEARLGSAPR